MDERLIGLVGFGTACPPDQQMLRTPRLLPLLRFVRQTGLFRIELLCCCCTHRLASSLSDPLFCSPAPHLCCRAFAVSCTRGNSKGCWSGVVMWYLVGITECHFGSRLQARNINYIVLLIPARVPVSIQIPMSLFINKL